MATNSSEAPPSQARPLSLSFQPWPVTCHEVLMAYWRAATSPSPDHSRPTTPTIEAALRLLSAADGVDDGLGRVAGEPQAVDHAAGQVGVAGGEEAEDGDREQQQGEDRQEARQGHRRGHVVAVELAIALLDPDRGAQDVQVPGSAHRSILSSTPGLYPGAVEENRPPAYGSTSSTRTGSPSTSASSWTATAGGRRSGACPAPRATARARKPCSTPSRGRSSSA